MIGRTHAQPVVDCSGHCSRCPSEPPTRSRLRLRLEWLAVAMALCASGCIAPCTGGVCNSPASLFRLPTPRYNATECVTDNGCGEAECEKGSCKPQPYFTFNKYCPWFDEWHTTSTAKRCANRILLKQQWQTLKLMPADYRKGFRQAFVDVAHGSDGELPAVPPPVYWNAHFRSDSGQQKAEYWFSGYRAGAAMAAVQLAPMKRIAASYDWTVQKPKSPFVGGECLPCGMIGQSGGNIQATGFQRADGPHQQFGPAQQFGPPQPFGPQTPVGMPLQPQQRFGPQPMLNSGPPANGPPAFAPGVPSGQVENLPAPNGQQVPSPMGAPQGVPAPTTGGLAPGHSMPGVTGMSSPPMTNPQPGATSSTGSLMPGFSRPGPSNSGRMPAAALGPWSEPSTEKPVY